MEQYIDDLTSNPLFTDIESIEILLKCLSVKTVSYKQEDFIILSGSEVHEMGIILSGHVKVIKENIDGNIVILSELSSGEIFAEAFLCAGITVSPVTVQGSSDCEILFINYNKVNNTCSKHCQHHYKLLQNMLRLIARKSVMLSQKIEIMAGRTIREKLLLYLNAQKGMANSKMFTIPYNREELAHYLCVDRSAMSRELCKMRDEGLISFRKNVFEILDFKRLTLDKI